MTNLSKEESAARNAWVIGVVVIKSIMIATIVALACNALGS